MKSRERTYFRKALVWTATRAWSGLTLVLVVSGCAAASTPEQVLAAARIWLRQDSLPSGMLVGGSAKLEENGTRWRVGLTYREPDMRMAGHWVCDARDLTVLAFTAPLPRYLVAGRQAAPLLRAAAENFVGRNGRAPGGTRWVMSSEDPNRVPSRRGEYEYVFAAQSAGVRLRTHVCVQIRGWDGTVGGYSFHERPVAARSLARITARDAAAAATSAASRAGLGPVVAAGVVVEGYFEDAETTEVLHCFQCILQVEPRSEELRHGQAAFVSVSVDASSGTALRLWRYTCARAKVKAGLAGEPVGEQRTQAGVRDEHPIWLQAQDGREFIGFSSDRSYPGSPRWSRVAEDDGSAFILDLAGGHIGCLPAPSGESQRLRAAVWPVVLGQSGNLLRLFALRNGSDAEPGRLRR